MIYKYKPEGISPNEFSGYQNSIYLFKNLTDGNINPKEVLKTQINFKSDLQSFTKYLRLTLVYMKNSALLEKFNFHFSRVF